MKLDSKAGFEEAYQQYGEAIYRFLYWQTKDLILSQDLTSATFERAWRARDSFKGGSVQAWLYRIARNLLTDHWRKKKELFMDDIPGLTERLEDKSKSYDFDQEKLLLEMSKALDQLSAELRAIVVLRFIEGMSAKEVGEILNISEGNVRIMQFRALHKMRKLINYEP